MQHQAGQVGSTETEGLLYPAETAGGIWVEAAAASDEQTNLSYPQIIEVGKQTADCKHRGAVRGVFGQRMWLRGVWVIACFLIS